MIKDLFKEGKTVFSFEVFPPKKEDEFEGVYSVLDILKKLNPEFISVTFGAGGGNSKKNLEIASYIQNDCGIEALAHLTSVGLNQEQLTSAYENLKARNVHNIMALRGDRPQTMTDEQFNNRSFTYASEMISFLKDNTDFCVGGACYPEKHFEAPSFAEDLRHLKEKVDCGADFLVTQLFFDNDKFYRLQEQMKQWNISIPVSAGIMPVTSKKQLGGIVSMSASSVPKKLSDIIATYGENPKDMEKAGLDFAVHQIEELTKHGVDGIHIYTMNRPERASYIMNALS